MKNQKKIRVGICAAIKDTPDYIFKEWVNHHFNIGIEKIIVYVDCGSKPIYQDERVEYVYLTNETKKKCLDVGNKYCFEPDCGSNFQVGLSNIELEKHRNDLDWLACIDDDEFLMLNIDDLAEYENETCVLLAWKMMCSYNIKCTYTLENYVEFPPYYFNVYSNRYTKPILNCKKCWADRDLHHGDYSGVIMDCRDITDEYNRNSLYITNNDVIYDIFCRTKNYIRHYKVRSFEEWVETVVDRKYNVYDIYNYSKRTWNREIKQFFSSNPFFAALSSNYDKNMLDSMLEKINRNDIKKTPYYDFAELLVDKKLTGNYTVIYNADENGMISNDKLKSMIKKRKKYIIIDYTFGVEHDFLKNYDKDNIITISKNEFILWMRLYNKKNHYVKPNELECVSDTIHEMYPKIEYTVEGVNEGKKFK